MKQVLGKVRLLLENTNADNLGLMKASIKFQLAKLDQVANLHESYREGANHGRRSHALCLQEWADPRA